MKGTTVLCFDFGLKRIGIAVGQTATNSGRPLTTINANSGIADAVALKKILNEWQPELAIIGQASTSGSKNQSNRRFNNARDAFIGQLTSQYDLQVEIIDEAYTTLAANNALAEQGIKAHNRTALRDQYAALEILNTWMNEQTIQQTNNPD
ncbi:MAG TPA: Holliday junction resolvase RuvX [Gammaproteobacteria bacterium]|jgi:putative holliday junction resolvase|nr:Holliday junction resolvase RuvX [Pseudomonadota bacterium]HAY45230.1 Holliday junction resolvase RuvX [Gammaproteobacteria bacterium]